MALKYLDYEGAKTFKNKIDEVIINEISEVNGNIDSVNNEVSALKGKLGSADGIATLGSDGKVLSTQLPSTTAGSTIIPVYFDNGVPKACDHKLEADVPADAKFTDTIYTLPVAGAALGGVKTDYSENGKNYALKVDGDGSAYVTVPWVDVNLSTLGISVTAAEINHLDGVTSNIQSQLNGKAASSHTHNYFGSVTKTYVNKKFTEATSSVTISEWTSAISGAIGKEIEIYYNGLLLLPTEEYTFNEGTGVITFVNTLGGVGVEQTLTAVIRVYK